MKEQSIRDVLGGGIKFHSDLDRMDKEELIGLPVILWDARIIDDWDSNFGTSQFTLLAVELEDGKRVTTLCGGKAVVRQIGKLQKLNKLPGRIKCFLSLVEGPHGNYYLLDSEERKNEEKTEKAQPEVAVS